MLGINSGGPSQTINSPVQYGMTGETKYTDKHEKRSQELRLLSMLQNPQEKNEDFVPNGTRAGYTHLTNQPESSSETQTVRQILHPADILSSEPPPATIAPLLERNNNMSRRRTDTTRSATTVTSDTSVEHYSAETYLATMGDMGRAVRTVSKYNVNVLRKETEKDLKALEEKLRSWMKATALNVVSEQSIRIENKMVSFTNGIDKKLGDQYQGFHTSLREMYQRSFQTEHDICKRQESMQRQINALGQQNIYPRQRHIEHGQQTEMDAMQRNVQIQQDHFKIQKELQAKLDAWEETSACLQEEISKGQDLKDELDAINVKNARTQEEHLKSMRELQAQHDASLEKSCTHLENEQSKARNLENECGAMKMEIVRTKEEHLKAMCVLQARLDTLGENNTRLKKDLFDAQNTEARLQSRIRDIQQKREAEKMKMNAIIQKSEEKIAEKEKNLNEKVDEEMQRARGQENETNGRVNGIQQRCKEAMFLMHKTDKTLEDLRQILEIAGLNRALSFFGFDPVLECAHIPVAGSSQHSVKSGSGARRKGKKGKNKTSEPTEASERTMLTLEEGNQRTRKLRERLNSLTPHEGFLMVMLERDQNVRYSIFCHFFEHQFRQSALVLPSLDITKQQAQ